MDSVTIPYVVIGFLLTIMLVLLGYIIAKFNAITKEKNDADKSDLAKMEASITANTARLNSFDTKLELLNFQVKPLWAKVQKQLSDDLHHPHAKDQEMDELLEKLENITIDETGTARLKVLLLARSRNFDIEVNDRERASARMMLEVMDMVVVEAASSEALTKVELVGERNQPTKSSFSGKVIQSVMKIVDHVTNNWSKYKWLLLAFLIGGAFFFGQCKGREWGFDASNKKVTEAETRASEAEGRAKLHLENEAKLAGENELLKKANEAQAEILTNNDKKLAGDASKFVDLQNKRTEDFKNIEGEQDYNAQVCGMCEDAKKAGFPLSEKFCGRCEKK